MGRASSGLSRVALATFGVALTACGVAYACDRAPLPLAASGILGIARFDAFEPFDSGVPLPTVPRNVAFLGVQEARVDDEPVALVALEQPFARTLGPFQAPADLLPAGGQVTAGNTTALVGDFEDIHAPSVPGVTTGTLDVADEGGGCGCVAQSSCGNSALVRMSLPAATDDHTPSDNILYAIYVATSPGEARGMEQPTELVFLKDGELQTFVDFRLSEVDVFVSVAAIDFAANHSERSEPMRIHRGDGGCAITHAGRSHVMSWILSALAVFWIGRRGRRALATSEASGS